MTETTNSEVSWDSDGLRSNQYFFGTQTDWNQTLYSKIQEEYIRGAKNSYIPNLILYGPQLAWVVESIQGFEYTNESIGGVGDLKKIGLLRSRFVLWESISLVSDNYIWLARSSDADFTKSGKEIIEAVKCVKIRID